MPQHRSIRLPTALYRELRAVARILGRPVEAVICEALEQHLVRLMAEAHQRRARPEGDAPPP